jgi:hypothetical protein
MPATGVAQVANCFASQIFGTMILVGDLRCG